MADSITPVRYWLSRIGYLALGVLPVSLLVRELLARKFPGRYVQPPHFYEFTFLYHLQEGLLVLLIIFLVGWLAAHVPASVLRFAIYFPLSLWLAWLVVWAMVRSAFTMELPPRYAIALLRDPTAISGVGLDRSFFYPSVGVAVAVMFAMSIAGSYLSRRVSGRFSLVTLISAVILFLAVHLPVRAYVMHHSNQNQQAVRALDDWSPIAVRSEEFIPGLQPPRPSLPNLESEQRTQAYMDWVKNAPKPEIPRKLDIVWIVVEAFRADAIDEKTTPFLWSHAADFQLKLDRNHWSGGNASQFGLFSMFTGISGYHLQTFTREQVGIPFLEMLATNGYRIRVANRHYFAFEQFLPSVFPKPTIWGHPHAETADQEDAIAVDGFLADLATRPDSPSLDVIPFDATHWPFAFASEDKIFETPAKMDKRVHFTRTKEQAEDVRKCYRNASHGVDRQIGRIVEALRVRGALDHTVVIVAGDHGEEFFERGQIFHAGPTNDFQGRPVLWIHFPDAMTALIPREDLTSHTDIVPTLLNALGFSEDVLRTQGRSLLHGGPPRAALLTSEQGYLVPGYHALITRDYISRWRHGPRKFLFSGIDRRDGAPVAGAEWLQEAKRVYPGAAEQYEILPDPAAPLLPLH